MIFAESERTGNLMNLLDLGTMNFKARGQRLTFVPRCITLLRVLLRI